MTISIEEMRSFAAVAAQGTFSAAARALGRSQSVVSTHIAGMENELGIRLFVRGTPAKLTPAGEELLPGALRVLREAEPVREPRLGALQAARAPSLHGHRHGARAAASP